MSIFRCLALVSLSLGIPVVGMSVWAWERNPDGNFADWNTQVNCDKQASG